jgi:hypothetical protein
VSEHEPPYSAIGSLPSQAELVELYREMPQRMQDFAEAHADEPDVVDTVHDDIGRLVVLGSHGGGLLTIFAAAAVRHAVG